ncbi:GEVED domain-containing protein [Flavobacteriaceae bacterium TK19130]|nr:GEVED domain-containing protein [Thermobacterium salinum]
MKIRFSTFIFLFAMILGVSAQETDQHKPIEIGTVDNFQHVQSIASRTNLPPATTKKAEMQDGRSSRNVVVPGKDQQTENDFFASNPHQLEKAYQAKSPSLVFDAAASNSQPTDPSLAVGPDHVFVVFNTGFTIYDKSGNQLVPQTAPTAIFPSGGCCDLTVSYDNLAERWVITFLGGGAQVAVSDGPDPINDGWYTYTINTINDYQKLSVWSDGYYITDNTSNASNRVYALERDAFLAGDPSAQVLTFDLPGIATNGFYSPQALNITDDNHPAPGAAPIVYLQDDAWSGVSEDHVKLWTIDVDWDTPSNSTVSSPTELVTTEFISVFDGGSFSNLTQPGGGIPIDALQATIMNQAQFRKFGSHNSAVFNFVVDTDASSGERAGVRWLELRQAGDGQPWSIYQEGTYTSPDGKHAWHASMMMDLQGNIGMGYSGMAGPDTPNPTDFRVSSYYTGRYAADPLGTMTVGEELIASGNANIPGLRYGDYSKIDLDPVNDKEFWFINEYMNSGRKDVVGVFQIAPNFNDDVGVVSIDQPVTGTLSATETVEITIFNYGQNPASNFDVTYQVDGGPVVTETFTGTINSAETATYTFTATADLSTVGQTYSITSSTDYGADEDNTNDSTTKEVTYLEPNDIGVSSILSPNSGENLTASETVTVTINNYGGEPQSDFDVSYTINDGTPVTETVAGPLEGNSDVDYTFTQTADLSAFGTYNFTAYTDLAGDSDETNDEATKTVVNSNCQPQSDCTLGDGIRLFELGTISNASDCEPDGYGDFTNLITDLQQDTTVPCTVTTEYGNQFVTVWIDFNDDFVFTSDEKIVDNYEIADGETTGTFTETFDAVIPAGATLGEHLMRAKTNWNAAVPEDACDETTFGETEDYRVNIVEELGVNENALADSELIISSSDQKIFDISLTTQSDIDKLEVTVHNVLGQQLVFYRKDLENGSFNYTLDMSYVSSGVYLVRVGNSQFGKVEKIIVQ